MIRWRLLLIGYCLPLAILGCSIASAENPPAVRLEQVWSGVSFPVHLTHDGTSRVFIVEQEGRIRLVEKGKLQDKPFLDIKDRVYYGGECGLLSVAFHPKFQENGRFFVNYTMRDPQRQIFTRVSEFKADPTADAASAATERVLFRVRQPYANHNGGQILFGPDGYLYIGMGDGGSSGDPQGHGQDTRTYHGNILRISVDNVPHGAPYDVPSDNPFVGREDFLPEIWAYGLRNPWRISFDRKTGVCYSGDVGQNSWEEINIIEKGKNYGWNIMEGTHPFGPPRSQQGLARPIKEYGRREGVSVTGGYVYRGKRIPALDGWYVYGDFGSGRIWALKYERGKLVGDAPLLKTNLQISSFGEDVDGEIYVLDHGRGVVYRIAPVE